MAASLSRRDSTAAAVDVPDVASSPYELLDVDPATVTVPSLNRRWREVARRLHPDAPDGDAELFVRARTAFEDIRAALARGERPSTTSPVPAAATASPPPPPPAANPGPPQAASHGDGDAVEVDEDYHEILRRIVAGDSRRSRRRTTAKPTPRRPVTDEAVTPTDDQIEDETNEYSDLAIAIVKGVATAVALVAFYKAALPQVADRLPEWWRSFVRPGFADGDWVNPLVIATAIAAGGGAGYLTTRWKVGTALFLVAVAPGLAYVLGPAVYVAGVVAVVGSFVARQR